MRAAERILVALDTPDEDRALGLAHALAGRVGGVKVGLELFSAHGPGLVRKISGTGLAVFLDLKLHDIPNTAGGAAAAAARLGAAWLTVHALGGDAMIRRAVEAACAAAAAEGRTAPIVLAVTVLTSHDEADLRRIGLEGSCESAAVRLTRLARDAGAGGIVCSPREIAAVRAAFPSATVVVPGIRPAGDTAAGDDQNRAATPGRAVADGADRIVVGRPVTGAPDPAAAADAIAREIEEAS